MASLFYIFVVLMIIDAVWQKKNDEKFWRTVACALLLHVAFGAWLHQILMANIYGDHCFGDMAENCSPAMVLFLRLLAEYPRTASHLMTLALVLTYVLPLLIYSFGNWKITPKIPDNAPIKRLGRYLANSRARAQKD